MSTRGERIRHALAARGVRKQQALAAELDVHESAITRWKENAAMSLDNAIALGAVLDISLDWLLLGRGTIDSHKTGVSPDVVSSDLAQIAGRIGPESISLLLAAIDSIADDVAPSAPG
jgi:plasmid maintenance system antidote protein VapI